MELSEKQLLIFLLAESIIKLFTYQSSYSQLKGHSRF